MKSALDGSTECGAAGKNQTIDASKISSELGWTPRHNVEQGLEATVRWYLDQLDWCRDVRQRSGYSGERIGVQSI